VYPWEWSSSEWYTLENVRAVHSFLESSALRLFGGVVGCDLAAFLLEHWIEPEWKLKWRAALHPPVPIRKVELHRLLKTLSMVFFAAAIALEVWAFQYSERLDDLQQDDQANVSKQTRSALLAAAASNKEAAQAMGHAGDADKAAAIANREAGKANQEASQLRKDAEGIKKDNLQLQARLREVAKQQDFRTLDAVKFLLPLKGQPTATVSVWYVPEDVESLSLANQIGVWIGKGPNNDGAGWQLKEFRSFPPNAVPANPHVNPNIMSLPLAIRFEGGSGVTVLSSTHRHMPDSINSPLSRLITAIAGGVGIAVWNMPIEWVANEELVIVVGQKPPPLPPLPPPQINK
jgi:hypothetical protein